MANLPNSGAAAPDDKLGALGGSIGTATAMSAVTRRLLDYFTGGAISPGDRLPPERQLALTLGVGRSAVREALAALELLGVVTVRPGSGTYLRGKASELLPQTLSWGILIGAPETRELVGVRHALEVQAARTAAAKATPTSLAEIGRQLADMAAHRDDLDAFVAADMRFHQAVAAAAGNTVLANLLQTLRSLIRVWVERALNDSEHADLTLAEHTAIFEAIRDRDATAAADAMNVHMESATERLESSLSAQ